MSGLQAVTCNVSVLTPTFQQAAFIGRAISSLFLQPLQERELLLVDDGSEGAGSWRAVQPWRCDHRMRYRRLPHHRGLGAALNEAMAAAQGSRSACLPSDAIYYRDHLVSLAALLQAAAAAIMACSGLLHPYKQHAKGRIDAGWRHRLVSSHGGELQRANWDDLNDPARITTFAVAGASSAVPWSPARRWQAHSTSVCFTRKPATWPRSCVTSHACSSCGNRCGKSTCSSALTTTSAASWPFSAKRCVIGASAGVQAAMHEGDAHVQALQQYSPQGK